MIDSLYLITYLPQLFKVGVTGFQNWTSSCLKFDWGSDGTKRNNRSEANCKLLDYTYTGPATCHSVLQILPQYLVFKATVRWSAKSGAQLTDTKQKDESRAKERREELQRELLWKGMGKRHEKGGWWMRSDSEFPLPSHTGKWPWMLGLRKWKECSRKSIPSICIMAFNVWRSSMCSPNT